MEVQIIKVQIMGREFVRNSDHTREILPIKEKFELWEVEF